MITLFPHQSDAFLAVETGFDRGARSQLVVMATGTGKTILFMTGAQSVIEAGGRVLVLVHRDELLQQAVNAAMSVGLEPVVEKADEHACPQFTRCVGTPGLPGLEMTEDGPKLVIASVQTLQRKRLTAWPSGHFTRIITDEAHHAASDSYRKVIDHFRPRQHLGVTATWDRGDKRPIVGPSQVFESVAYEYSMWQAVTDGRLARPVVRVLDCEIDLRGIRTTGGDFNAGDLEEIISPRVEELCRIALPHIEGRTTLVFTPDCGSADLVADAFRAMGLGAASVRGGDADRGRVVADFRNRRYQLLSNCQLFSEGTDFPFVDCILSMRPTKSRPLFVQQVGRGTRNFPGKTECIAEGSLVLTDVGPVPIEQVTLGMRVWDGCEFVSHAGAVCRGEQETIGYAGIEATPDHQVWAWDGWRSFGECAEKSYPIAVTGLGGSEVRLSEGLFRGCYKVIQGKGDDLDRMYAVRRVLASQLAQRDSGLGWVREVLKEAVRSEVALQKMCPGSGPLPEHQEPEAQGLRGEGDRVSVPFGDGNGLVGPRGTWDSPGIATGSDRERRALRGGEPPVQHERTEPFAHPKESGNREVALVQDESSRDPLRGFDSAGDDPGRYERQGDRREIPSTVVQAKRRVWDILDAGPRYRFTVEGLLVSNCRILAYNWKTVSHQLVKPVELFAGPGLDPVDMWAASSIVENGIEHDLMAAVKQARADRAEEEERKERARLRAKVKNTTAKHVKSWTFDPLAVDGDRLDQMSRDTPPSDSFVRRATDRQLVALEKCGYKPEQVVEWTAERASRTLDALSARRAAGLASVKQVTILKKYGFADAESTTFVEANRRIAIIASGWRR